MKFDKSLICGLAVLALVSVTSVGLNAQEPQQPDVYEQAEKEADRLQSLLDLEDWQVFYVDSTLKHDCIRPCMTSGWIRLT